MDTESHWVYERMKLYPCWLLNSSDLVFGTELLTIHSKFDNLPLELNRRRWLVPQLDYSMAISGFGSPPTAQSVDTPHFPFTDLGRGE